MIYLLTYTIYYNYHDSQTVVCVVALQWFELQSVKELQQSVVAVQHREIRTVHRESSTQESWHVVIGRLESSLCCLEFLLKTVYYY